MKPSHVPIKSKHLISYLLGQDTLIKLRFFMVYVQLMNISILGMVQM